MIRFFILAFVLLFPPVMLHGCVTPSPEQRLELADSIAKPVGFTSREIVGTPFVLTAYERVTQPGAPVRVYIEGDGLAWASRSRPSDDPTPTDPVALRLAAVDNAPNVVYLGRPCQYSKNAACGTEYWTMKRFGIDVLKSMNAALDNVKRKYDARGFEMVGFSGGGAVAALLTAKRRDVLTLRTVGGNLDTAEFTTHHGVTPLEGSLNPVDYAQRIIRVPQRHFVGDKDKIITRKMGKNFIRATGHPECLNLTVVKNTAHEDGWVKVWPQLLAAPLEGGCAP